MHVAPGLQIAGKYLILQPLARGGMGSVWVARHIALNTPVALKLLDPHYASSPDLLARFEREARAASALDTPHVVQVRDYGVDQGTPYLVMELLRGEDLRARLKRESRLPLRQLHTILVQLAKALRKAHQAGIVHRDLKPANIFLARVDDEEVVKVLDFGIAKELLARVGDATKSGEVFGSPHYMSPEQARAEKTVDARSDLWSVGVILYRAATGHLPFPGDAIGEILSRLFVEAPPRPTSLAPDLPPAIDAFFDRALAKPKEQRFQTVAELVEAFAAVATGGMESATSPPGPRPAFSSIAELPPPTASFAPVFTPGPPRGPLPPYGPTAVPAVTAAPSVDSTLPLDAAARASSAADTLGTHSGASHTTRTGPARSRGTWPLVAGGLALAIVATALLVFVFSHEKDPAAAATDAPAPIGSTLAQGPPPAVTPAPTGALADTPSSVAVRAPAPTETPSRLSEPSLASPAASPPASPAKTSAAATSTAKTAAPTTLKAPAAPSATATPAKPPKKPDRWGLPD